MQDDFAAAQLVRLPTRPQLKWLAENLHRADAKQRERIEQIVPDLRRKVGEIINVLITEI